jgi:hypothetical protein
MYSSGKSFIRIALLFALATTAVAPGYGRGPLQTGGAVLAGDPPLTIETSDQIREVFEWLLETRLTPAQHRRFQQLLVADWSAEPGKSNEVYLGFLKLRSQLADATPEQRDAARARIGPEFVQALYRPPVDGQRRRWRVVRDGESVKLCVRDQDGDSACYTRR